MSRFADLPRTPEEWMNGTTLREETPEPEFLSRDGAVFHARILRYLEWFGLMEKQSIAANDDWRNPYLFRKTPLFERFISFRL